MLYANEHSLGEQRSQSAPKVLARRRKGHAPSSSKRLADVCFYRSVNFVTYLLVHMGRWHYDCSTKVHYLLLPTSRIRIVSTSWLACTSGGVVMVVIRVRMEIKRHVFEIIRKIRKHFGREEKYFF
jgi:hypothetical protein